MARSSTRDLPSICNPSGQLRVLIHRTKGCIMRCMHVVPMLQPGIMVPGMLLLFVVIHCQTITRVPPYKSKFLPAHIGPWGNLLASRPLSPL
eukprot:3991616-Amphidinium_carterae.2